MSVDLARFLGISVMHLDTCTSVWGVFTTPSIYPLVHRSNSLHARYIIVNMVLSCICLLQALWSPVHTSDRYMVALAMAGSVIDNNDSGDRRLRLQISLPATATRPPTLLFQSTTGLVSVFTTSSPDQTSVPLCTSPYGPNGG